jgi:sigma-B regulation protein RsbU (phosphoserine phosphatase)
LGDVVGKGLSAAMYGALVVGTLRGLHKSGTRTASLLATLNDRLLERPLHGRFCCTLYAVFNPATGELEFSNAGLPLPLLISEAKCQPLGEGGFPSGMFAAVTYDDYRVHLLPGDSVLFATDGLHECSNSDGREFGTQHLAESWAKCRYKSADESLNFLFDNLHTFSNGTRMSDDISMLVLKIPSKASQPE